MDKYFCDRNKKQINKQEKWKDFYLLSIAFQYRCVSGLSGKDLPVGHFLLVLFLTFCPIVNTLTLIVGFTAAIFNK